MTQMYAMYHYHLKTYHFNVKYNYNLKTFYLSSNGRINDKSDIEAKMGGDLKRIHKLVFFIISI